MDRLEWRHAVIASAVICLAVAIPIGLSANDPDAPPALLIPILAIAFFAMLWLCGFLAVFAIRLPFDLWRLWQSPEKVEQRVRRATAAREARARRAAKDAARRAADSGPWWEALLGGLAAILVVSGLAAGIVATRIHWNHIGPAIEAVFNWVDANGWVVPLGVAVLFSPMLAFIAVDHVKKRRRSRTASIEARRRMKDHFNREFSVCPNCGVQSFEIARGRCYLQKCFESTQPLPNAPHSPVSRPVPANEARFPMSSSTKNRWQRCSDCGLQYAGARDCPACARSSA